MAEYAWVITRDHLDDKAVYVAGPHDATPEQLAVARKDGKPFNIYDDDGYLYYSGRYVGPDDEAMFGPLDDYGAPNAGATEIRYREASGKYVIL
jgi:hypothetical protein